MPANVRTDAKRTNDGAQSAASVPRTSKELLRPEDIPQVLQTVFPAIFPFDRKNHEPPGIQDGRSDGFKNLEVEIGCGNGHFMIEYCRLNLRSLFIGIEIKKKRCLKAQAKIDNQHRSNARVVYGSAEEALHYLPDGFVNTFHLYYPDPWPKSKHRRRRFLRRENIEILQRKLQNGGFILFVTDFFDYYFHTKVLILLQDGLELASQAPNRSIFQSMFAKRFQDMGKRVYHLAARKTGTPGMEETRINE